MNDVATSGAAEDGSLRGELAAYTSDEVDGPSETRYFLRDRSGSEQRLVFDAVVRAEDLQPETQIHVWGQMVGDAFHVTHVETPNAEIARVTSALRNAAPYAPRSFAFVMLDMGAGVNTTADAAMGRLITGADSIRNYYLSDSYGSQDVTAQTFGPMPYTLTNGCGTSQLATAMRAMIPGTFQHYLWYFGSRQAACSWTGLASVGSPDKPSRDTWYNASTSCVVLVQEPGHNFGMQHSSSIACPGATFADDVNTCTGSEYGDPFDPMGGGCRHMNAWQKDYQGWFGGCNGVNVGASGTFTLLPIEQKCDGVQFLKIPAPKVRMFNRPAAGGGGATVETFSHYYVELRTPQDFDGMLGNRTVLAPQVLVHIGGDRRARNARGLHTFLLDMTPATTGRTGIADSALGVGKSYSDPAGGLTITVQAVSATQATINVEVAANGAGGPTCLDDTPFTAPGPGQESCSAAAPTGAAGAPGPTGAAGTQGTNGGAGTSGGAGTAGGAAGRGGAAGTTGTNTGAAGTGPSPTTGTAGTQGTNGGAGTTATPTTGVAGTQGVPSNEGAAGAGPGSHETGEVVGHGCGCETSGSSPTSGAFATLFTVSLATFLARARRRRLRAVRAR